MANGNDKNHPTQAGYNELQVVLWLMSSSEKTPEEISRVLSYNDSYYSLYGDVVNYIREYYSDYDQLPSYLTLRGRFEVLPPNPELYTDNVDYLIDRLEHSKKTKMANNIINIIASSNDDNIDDVLDQISIITDEVRQIGTGTYGSRYKADAANRPKEIENMNKALKIPTGFDEIDRCMGGGLSTFEELFLIEARTNVGKSWVCAKIASSAINAGINVLYYSPEMQATVLNTRVDTWEGKGTFENSKVMKAQFNDEYLAYIQSLSDDENDTVKGELITVEDKDFSDNVVTAAGIESYVIREHIQLVIIDGLGYMSDMRHGKDKRTAYGNICKDLFRISKQKHCAMAVAVQANRETKNNSDDDDTKGFPDLYNIEGSDEPGRISTGVIALRKDYDATTRQQYLSIKIQKLRNAGFTNDVLKYSWDPDKGHIRLQQGDASVNNSSFNTTTTTSIQLDTSNMPSTGSFNIPNMPDDNVDAGTDESIDF